MPPAFGSDDDRPMQKFRGIAAGLALCAAMGACAAETDNAVIGTTDALSSTLAATIPPAEPTQPVDSTQPVGSTQPVDSILTSESTTSAPTSVVTSTADPSTGDETELAYQADRLVQLVGIDGQHPHAVANDVGAGQEHPDWSSDGEQLAYDVEFSSIWVTQVDLGESRQIFDCVAPCVSVQDPAWSPDGASIAFAAAESVDGENTSRAAILSVDVETGEVSTLYDDTTGRNWLYSPRWAPDGASIVFEEYGFATTLLSDSDSVMARVAVLGIDTGDAMYIVEDADATGNGGLGRPDWSPDGSSIVFQRDSNLWLIAPDGTDERALTNYDGANEHGIQPTFSPDGRLVIFTYVTGQFGDDDQPTAAQIALDGSGFATIGGGGRMTHPRLRPALEAIGIEDAGGVRFDVAGEPDWVTLADGYVFSWTTGVGRFDAVTGELLSTTDIGTASICLAMDAGFGSVWVGLCGVPALMRLDPATGDVQATIPLPVSDLHPEGSLAAGEGGVFAVASSEEQVVKVDPSTNTVAATFEVPHGAAAVRAGFGAVWVTYPERNEVLRMDPASGEVTGTTNVGSGPRFLAVGDEGVWVMNQGDGTVSRIDPETSDVIATVHVNDGPISFGDIAVGGGSVWVRTSDHLLVRVDASTNQVTGAYDPPSGSGGVDADSEAVWLSAHDVNAMWRLPLDS